MNSNITVIPDATTILEGLRAGTMTSESVVQAHLDLLNKQQATVNGATTIYDQEALALAKELDRNGDRSLPLFGLPCSVKETFGIAGEEVTAGSIRMKPEYHTEDSEIVKRLRNAGAVIIARSNIPEFAMTGESSNLRFGRCNNPHNTTRGAGGSSGGEGALVGSGASVFGVGSDILGSIRIPAAFCGTVGFKPHSKAIDGKGTWPVINSSNLVDWLAYGPICRSVRDAQLIYNVLAEKPVQVADDLFENLVIPDGFPITYQERCIEDAVNAARNAVLEHGLKSKNISFNLIPELFLNIAKIFLNDFYDGWISDLSSSSKYGKFSLIKELFNSLMGKPTIDGGLLLLILLKPLKTYKNEAEKIAVEHSFTAAKAEYQHLIGDSSVIILPTLGLVAPKHKVFNRKAILNPKVNGLFTCNTLGNYLDLSVLTVPAWKFCDPATGLPASVSLMCTAGNEAKLFATAKIVEAALN